MPENWPPRNDSETPREVSNAVAEKTKARAKLHDEIIKLKRKIVEEEERIDRIPNWLNKDIAQNALNADRGLFEKMVDKYTGENKQS